MTDEMVSQLTPGTDYFICYLSKDGACYSERTITVKEIFRREGTWYVIADCHLRNERRSFLLSGVLDARSCPLPTLAPFGPTPVEVAPEVAAAWLTTLTTLRVMASAG